MIIKIKCDEDCSLYDVLETVSFYRNAKDGTHLTYGFRVHKTTTAKQVEYVVERVIK